MGQLQRRWRRAAPTVLALIWIAACGGGDTVGATVTVESTVAPALPSTTVLETTTTTTLPLSHDLTRDTLLAKARPVCAGTADGVVGASGPAPDRSIILWVPPDHETFLISQELTPPEMDAAPDTLACLSYRTLDETIAECAYQGGSAVYVQATIWSVRFLRADNGALLSEEEVRTEDDFCSGAIWVAGDTAELRHAPNFDRDAVEALAADLNPWVSPQILCTTGTLLEVTTEPEGYQTAVSLGSWMSPDRVDPVEIPAEMQPLPGELPAAYLCVYHGSQPLDDRDAPIGTAVYLVYEDLTLLGEWRQPWESYDDPWLPDENWITDNVGPLLGYP